jgi:hypothetical protein
MYQQYKSQADFYVVYIREAHPIDGWRVAKNDRDGIHLSLAKTESDRVEAAQLCGSELHLSIPMVLDRMDDYVEKRYGGWPDRLYIVGRDGKVAYKGDKGPHGFKPDQMEIALKALLAVGN